MIIKGKSRGNGAQLGQYLVSPGENERIQVIEIRGVAASDIPGALREMDALSRGARTKKGLYHAQINTPVNERLTEAQRALAVEKLGEQLGFSGQPYVVVVHEKSGREHTHVVWSRIDLEHMRAIPDGHNYRKHEEVARALEREFSLTRVQGAHAEREGKARPRRTPSRAEMQQAERTGLTPQQVTREVTALWRSTGSGQAFANALADAGYILARGDRRDFVVIDPKGGVHSLARRIEGERVKDVRERLADIDAGRLPSVAGAKAIQRERSREGLIEGSRKSGRTDLPSMSAKSPKAEEAHGHATAEKVGAETRALDGVTRGIGSLFDGIANIFERGLTGEAAVPEPERGPSDRHAGTTAVESSALADEEQRSKRRQELLREFGRELENEREAPFERERRRSR